MKTTLTLALTALVSVGAAYASVRGYLVDSQFINDSYGNKIGITCFYHGEQGAEFSLNYMGTYAACPREVEVQ